MSIDIIRKTNLKEAGFLLDHSDPKQASDEVVVVLDIPLHEHGDKNKCHVSATSHLRRVVQVLVFYTMNLDVNYRAPSGPIPTGYARFYLSMSTKLANPNALYEQLRSKLADISVSSGQQTVWPQHFHEQGLKIDCSYS